MLLNAAKSLQAGWVLNNWTFITGFMIDWMYIGEGVQFFILSVKSFYITERMHVNQNIKKDYIMKTLL